MEKPLAKKPKFTTADVGKPVLWRRHSSDQGLVGTIVSVPEGGIRSYLIIETSIGTRLSVSPADLEFAVQVPITGPNPAGVWAGRRPATEEKITEQKAFSAAEEWVNPPTMMNLKELICGDINRLSYVPRYSTTFLIRSENVAEHTALVSLYCVFIAAWVRKNTALKVDMEKLLIRAAIHDLEEVRTGDINRTAKHYDVLFKERLDDVGMELMAESVTRILPDDNGFITGIMMAWSHSKDNSPEGRILSFADFLQALSFISREYALGNKSVTEPPISLPPYYTKFKDPSYDFLRPLISQVADFMDETFGKG